MGLESHFEMTYAMVKYHNFTLTELYDMTPFEFEFYAHLIRVDLEKQQQQEQNQGTIQW